MEGTEKSVKEIVDILKKNVGKGRIEDGCIVGCNTDGYDKEEFEESTREFFEDPIGRVYDEMWERNFEANRCRHEASKHIDCSKISFYRNILGNDWIIAIIVIVAVLLMILFVVS